MMDDEEEQEGVVARSRCRQTGGHCSCDVVGPTEDDFAFVVEEEEEEDVVDDDEMIMKKCGLYVDQRSRRKCDKRMSSEKL